jgi:hypothetical protein
LAVALTSLIFIDPLHGADSGNGAQKEALEILVDTLLNDIVAE